MENMHLSEIFKSSKCSIIEFIPEIVEEEKNWVNKYYKTNNKY